MNTRTGRPGLDPLMSVDLRLSEVTTLAPEQWLDGHRQFSRSRAAEIRIALRGAFRSAVRLGSD